MKQLVSLFVTLLASTACAHATTARNAPPAPLETVSFVDLQRYLGKWYEIASLPAPFQNHCVGSTAEYSLRQDGKINVTNRCFDKTFDGDIDEVSGKAWIVDTTTNAKLKVQFFWPFSGNYWVIDLDPEYSRAVVSEPSRKYLWILNREPRMAQDIYDGIISRLNDKGFDLSELKLTPQQE
jgi:apolipoprotein D and lipocalin family protein